MAENFLKYPANFDIFNKFPRTAAQYIKCKTKHKVQFSIQIIKKYKNEKLLQKTFNFDAF